MVILGRCCFLIFFFHKWFWNCLFPRFLCLFSSGKTVIFWKYLYLQWLFFCSTATKQNNQPNKKQQTLLSSSLKQNGTLLYMFVLDCNPLNINIVISHLTSLRKMKRNQSSTISVCFSVTVLFFFFLNK